jgi:glycosyltransferase involved in cell wall biosynthesis
LLGDGDIRVLMVDSEDTWRGGQAQVALLIRGLAEWGVGVVLAAPPGSAIAEKAREIEVPVRELRIAGDADLGAVWRLGGYIREDRFDIVHCHSSHAHGAAWLALALGHRKGSAGARRPKLVVSRRVDFPVGGNGPAALKYRRGVDMFLAISNGVRRVLLDGGVREEKITLVPSGIDLGKFDGVGGRADVDREFGFREGTTVVGNVAALAPHKSQADFVRAARIVRGEIPSARFLIVGEGELREDLEALAKELGLERDLTLTGFRRDALSLLSRFDCFVLSSYLEGLCTSIMDAQALGVPVVATRTGGVPDLVEDGETGLLVPPRDPERLGAAVIRMLRDGELRSRCVERAREKSKTYDYRRMVERTLDTYRRLLARAD